MFGIKTKKDKRIEELEKRLFLLSPMAPTIIKQERNIGRATASILLDDQISVDRAKRFLKEKIIKQIEEAKALEYQIVDEGPYRKIICELNFIRRDGDI